MANPLVPGVSVTAYYGTDGTLVIEIDGADDKNGENDKGPVMRIYLNDDPIFENPPYPTKLVKENG